MQSKRLQVYCGRTRTPISLSETIGKLFSIDYSIFDFIITQVIELANETNTRISIFNDISNKIAIALPRTLFIAKLGYNTITIYKLLCKTYIKICFFDYNIFFSSFDTFQD